MSNIDKIKKDLTAPRKIAPVDFSQGLSSGSALINLACTGCPDVAFLKGKFYHLVGDSSSGKTFLTLTCLAEATKNPHFKNYRFIYDNTEDGSLMNMERFFGKKVADRLEPPLWEGKSPKNSDTIEEFYFNIDDACEAGKPFIYILDSMDGLTSESEEEKFKEQKDGYRKGKDVSGSYGDGKAKKNSGMLRIIRNGLEDTGSILIVIDQTRDNIGFGAQFTPKTHSGGRALKFYATLQIWTSVKKTVTKNVMGKSRQTGIIASVEIKKNRVTGQVHKVDVPIHWSYGIDDVGGVVQWMIDEGFWKKEGRGYKAADLGISGTADGLVAQIEEKGLEKELYGLVAESWNEIVDSCTVARKRRYE